MKTTLILSLLILSIAVNAQIVNIPDPHFKNALLNHDNFGGEIIDTNGDGEIQVSEAEAITELILGDPWISFNIQDLTGIEAFVNITHLDVHNNQLTTLNVNANNLLEELYCYDNSMVSIDVSENFLLKKLYCGGNPLTHLNVRNNVQLIDLTISQTNITFLDVSQNTELLILACASTQLTNLDLTNNINLELFTGQNSNLTQLDFRNNNNEKILAFKTKDNPDLTCIFVDDAEYSETNWTDVDPASTFVETQEECDALGFKDMSYKQINIYPNPVKSTLNIELSDQDSKEFHGEIIDITGKTIATHLLKTDTSLDVSYLPSGIYFLSIRDNQNKLLIKKLVKL